MNNKNDQIIEQSIKNFLRKEKITKKLTLESIGVGIVGTGFMGTVHTEALEWNGIQVLGMVGSTLGKAKNLVSAVNFNVRLYPLIQHARNMVINGEIGVPFLIHGSYLQDWLPFD